MESKPKWRLGNLVKIVSVARDQFQAHNEAIAKAGGLLVKAITPPRIRSDGTYWFTGKALKNYPEIRTKNYPSGIMRGDEIKFDYVHIVPAGRKRSRQY